MKFNGKTLDVSKFAARLRKIDPTADIQKEFKSAIDSYVLKREGIYAMATMDRSKESKDDEYWEHPDECRCPDCCPRDPVLDEVVS